MKIGQVVYFYYDTVIPCQKGIILEIINNEYNIGWLYENDKQIGSCVLPLSVVFSSKKECIDYSLSLEDEKQLELIDALSSKELVLNYLYSFMHSEDYDWSPERKVVKNRIKELFDIDVS